MLIVGLTGNFGMGKSYLLSVFRSLGAVTLDSDRIVGLLLKEVDVIEKVKTLLGREVIDPAGKLDKKIITDKVFNNSKLRERLEVLLHPMVFDKIDDFLDRIKDKKCIVIVEVPLLFEGDYQNRFKRVITVYTTEKTALERLKTAGISRKEVLSRLKVQLPINIKKKLADYTIDNNGSRQKTRRQTERIYNKLLEEMKEGLVPS